MPWHAYRKLSSVDKGEILADYQEHCLREGYRAKKLEEKNKKKDGAAPLGVEDWL